MRPSSLPSEEAGGDGLAAVVAEVDDDFWVAAAAGDADNPARAERLVRDGGADGEVALPDVVLADAEDGPSS